MSFKGLVTAMIQYHDDRDPSAFNIIEIYKKQIKHDLIAAFEIGQPLIEKFSDTFRDSSSFVNFLFTLNDIEFNCRKNKGTRDEKRSELINSSPGTSLNDASDSIENLKKELETLLNYYNKKNGEKYVHTTEDTLSKYNEQITKLETLNNDLKRKIEIYEDRSNKDAKQLHEFENTLKQNKQKFKEFETLINDYKEQNKQNIIEFEKRIADYEMQLNKYKNENKFLKQNNQINNQSNQNQFESCTRQLDDCRGKLNECTSEKTLLKLQNDYLNGINTTLLQNQNLSNLTIPQLPLFPSNFSNPNLAIPQSPVYPLNPINSNLTNPHPPLPNPSANLTLTSSVTHPSTSESNLQLSNVPFNQQATAPIPHPPLHNPSANLALPSTDESNLQPSSANFNQQATSPISNIHNSSTNLAIPSSSNSNLQNFSFRFNSRQAGLLSPSTLMNQSPLFKWNQPVLNETHKNEPFTFDASVLNHANLHGDSMLNQSDMEPIKQTIYMIEDVTSEEQNNLQQQLTKCENEKKKCVEDMQKLKVALNEQNDTLKKLNGSLNQQIEDLKLELAQNHFRGFDSIDLKSIFDSIEELFDKPVDDKTVKNTHFYINILQNIKGRLNSKNAQLEESLNRVNYENDCLKDQKNQLSKENKRSQDELIQQLQNLLKSHNVQQDVSDQIKMLNENVNELTEINTTLKVDNERLIQHSVSLNNQILEYKTKILERENMIAKLNNDYRSLQTENTKIKSHLTRCTNDLASEKTQNIELNRSVESVNSTNSKLTKEIESLNQDYTSYETQLETCLKENSDVSKQLQECLKANKQMQQDTEQVRQLNKMFSEKIKILELKLGDIKQLEERKRQLELEKQELNTEIQALGGEKFQLNTEIQALAEQKCQLNAEIQALAEQKEIKIHHFEEVLKNYTQEKNKLIENFSQEFIQHLEHNFALKDIQNVNLEQLNKTLLTEMADWSNKNAELLIQNEDLRRELFKRKTETSEIFQQTSKTNENQTQSETQISDLQTQNEKEILDLQTQKEPLDKEKKTLVSNITELEAPRKKENEDLTEKCKKCIQEHNVKIIHASLLEENQNLKKEREKKLTILRGLNTYIKIQKKQIATKKNIINRLDNEIKVKRLSKKRSNLERVEALEKKKEKKPDKLVNIKALKKYNQTLSNDNKQLKEKLQSCIQQNDILEKQLKDVKKNKNTLEKDLNSVTNSNTQNMTEIAALKKSLTENEATHLRLLDEYNESKKNFEKIKDKYDEKIKSLNVLLEERFGIGYTQKLSAGTKRKRDVPIASDSKKLTKRRSYGQLSSIQNPNIEIDDRTPSTSKFEMPDVNLNDFNADFTDDNIAVTLTSGSLFYETEGDSITSRLNYTHDSPYHEFSDEPVDNYVGLLHSQDDNQYVGMLDTQDDSFDKTLDIRDSHYNETVDIQDGTADKALSNQDSIYDASFNRHSTKLKDTNVKLLFIAFYEYHFKKISNPNQINLLEEDLKLLNDLKELLNDIKTANKDNYTYILYLYIDKQICALTNINKLEHYENIDTINELLIYTFHETEKFIKNLKAEENLKNYLEQNFTTLNTTNDNFMNYTVTIFKTLVNIFKTSEIANINHQLELLYNTIIQVYPKFEEKASEIVEKEQITQETFIFYLLNNLKKQLFK